MSITEIIAGAMEPLVNEDFAEPWKSAWLTDLGLTAITALEAAGYVIVPKDAHDALSDAVYVVRNMTGESEWCKRNGWRDPVVVDEDFIAWADHWQEAHESVRALADQHDRAMIQA